MKHFYSLIAILLFSSYACNRIVGPVSAYEVHGVDVSHYQSDLDWDTIQRQGIDFAFIKATEGVTLQDSNFCSNWEELDRINMWRGAYHFFRPGYSAHRQADTYLHLVDLKAGDLPPVLDVEVLDGVSRIDLIKGMYIWLYRVEIATGVKPIIYTNQRFYNTHLRHHFGDYRLWIARYNSREPRLAGDRSWHFWQYSSQGDLPGVQGDIDLNVFRGSLQELSGLSKPGEQVVRASP